MCGVGIRMVCAVFLPSLHTAAPHQYFHSHLCCRENEAQMSEVERDLEGLVKFFSLYHSQSKKYEQGWSW